MIHRCWISCLFNVKQLWKTLYDPATKVAARSLSDLCLASAVGLGWARGLVRPGTAIQ